jgi:cyanophycin synthetase
MSATASVTAAAKPVRFPSSFRQWQDDLRARGVPPVIAIGGSRGKTTVVRLLDASFRAAGLRTAVWTDRGVEVLGRRQRGELGPWSRALARLGQGSLDVAIQELDWSTVHAVGLPAGVYPVVLVTNLCGNSEACLARPDTALAAGSLARLLDAVHPAGVLVLSGEDVAVSASGHGPAPTVLVGASRDSPLVRSHLAAGGAAAWPEDGSLVVGTEADPTAFASVLDLPITAGGAVGFQIQNVLAAAAAAAAAGIPPERTASVIERFAPAPHALPGSFNVVPVGDATVVVDRPAPSWFLRPALRAVGHLGARRHVTVAGPMAAVPDDDLAETGRLLGRSGGALVLYGEVSPRRAALLRQGIATNRVPPVVIRVGTERQAVTKALRLLGGGDLALILTENPASVLRALSRTQQRLAS